MFFIQYGILQKQNLKARFRKHNMFLYGELVERLKAAVLKTVDGVVPHPRVRIPDSPP